MARTARALLVLEALSQLGLPPEVRCKVPEGYAFYALYPEAYLEAARALPAQGAPQRVIGLRSIGTGLSGVVAAALGAEAPLTVRPVGHPFRRTLSGSSFGAVADSLEKRGVPDHRLFFSTHGSPCSR